MLLDVQDGKKHLRSNVVRIILNSDGWCVGTSAGQKSTDGTVALALQEVEQVGVVGRILRCAGHEDDDWLG